MSYLYHALIFVCVYSASSQNFDYYWRDYYGPIPEDAIVGGKDINGNDIYIGQAYIHNHGLYVGILRPGKVEIEVPCYGVKKTDHLIKILCTGHKDKIHWFKTTGETYHVDTIDKHSVVGGYDHIDDKGILHIGRVMHQGELRFGNVAAYDPNTVHLYFPVKDKEKNTKVYEVLVYDNKTRVDLDMCAQMKDDKENAVL